MGEMYPESYILYLEQKNKEEYEKLNSWLIPLIQIADCVANEGLVFDNCPDANDVLLRIGKDLGMTDEEEIIGHTIIHKLMRRM